MARRWENRAKNLVPAGLMWVLACSSTEAHPDAGTLANLDASAAADATAADAAPNDSGGAQPDSGTPGEERQICVEVCSTGSSNCTPPTVCNGTRCVFPVISHPCVGDKECVPVGSFWDLGTACTTASTSCSRSAATHQLLEACIDVDGSGHCVRMPQNPSDCANRSQVEVAWTDIEGQAVTVCGRESYICENHECVPGCSDDGDCTSSLWPHCNQATRHCECNASSCVNANNGRLCKADGACGCDTDADCPGPGFDHCYQGRCGCSDTASCQDLLPQLNVVCEAP